MNLSKFIRWTSKKAFKEVSSDVTAKSRLSVLMVLSNAKCALSDRDIAVILGEADLNKVRPRRNELVKIGKVKEAGYKKCQFTNKLVLTWIINK